MKFQTWILLTSIFWTKFGYSAPQRIGVEYLKFKEQISASVFFGYNDQHPEVDVLDHVQKQNFVDKITQSCFDQETLCGFLYDFSEDDVFQKKWIVNGRQQSIKLKLFASSYTTYDPQNRDRFLIQQTEKSKIVSQLFESSLKNDDIIFYVGHARYGGGPDFNFAILNSSGLVDANYYRKNDASKKNMFKALSLAPERPQVLGLLACDSELHFYEGLNRIKKNSQFVLVNSIKDPHQMDQGLIFSFQYLLNQLQGKNLSKSFSGKGFVIK